MLRKKKWKIVLQPPRWDFFLTPGQTETFFPLGLMKIAGFSIQDDDIFSFCVSSTITNDMQIENNALNISPCIAFTK